jgi:preprotein translocase subunit SecE
MVTKKKTKNVKKKRKPKGKKLSEALEAKEAKRAQEEAEAEAAAREAAADDEEDDDDDDLASEPPPAYDEDEGDEDEDDEDERDVYAREADDQDEDGDARAETDDDDDDDDDEPPGSSSELGDDEEYEYEDDDEDLAAAQMGHQRYVMAGFFAMWLLAGYICGQTLEMLWSRFAAKDWFVETLPQLAAVPHEGDLISRASISLVVGAIIGAAIVLRYYFKPDVRQWADEVAEQLAHVKWPTRKEVGNNTVVVMVCSAVITAYLTLLDRFWGFVTTLIYTSGT